MSRVAALRAIAAYLLTACSSAMRPGELDALMWDDLAFTPDAETITQPRCVPRAGEGVRERLEKRISQPGEPAMVTSRC